MYGQFLSLTIVSAVDMQMLQRQQMCLGADTHGMLDADTAPLPLGALASSATVH